MPEQETSQQTDFMIEKIKERPVNKKKLFRRTVITVVMAVIFGLVACLTFLLLEPVISKKIYPEEEPAPIVFPEDPEEMLPEDMLADNLTDNGETDGMILEQEQIQEILSEVTLDKENYRQIYRALSDYVAELNYSMVTVTGVSSQIDWFNNVEKSQYQSSGVIIAENGRELLILADYFPLRRAESLYVTFVYLETSPGRSNHQVPAVIKAQDATTNLAILAVNLEDLPDEAQLEEGVKIASLGSSNTKNIVGTPVVAMGSPMGTSGSVGYGMITSAGSQSTQPETNFKYLQTDIYGSQNANGVLFNLQGQVIGVITTQKSGTDMKNIVFAYGITELKKRIEKMSNGIPIAYLGITGQDVTTEAHAELKVPYGAYVKDVAMDSPAMLAGIHKGDVITAIDGQNIFSYNDYINNLMQITVGENVELTIRRSVQGEYREMSFHMIAGEK